ncbi:MAG: hypothetical protein IT380_14830 [Myxococcales bacterium]|nr:hypothetical protein [Myxococcales bacterium]
MRRVAVLLLVLAAATAGAQELSPPPLLEPPPEVTPPPPVEAPPAPAPPAVAPAPEAPAPQPGYAPAPPPGSAPEDVPPSFFDRCFAVPAVYFAPAPRVALVGGVVVGAPPAPAPAPRSSDPGSLGKVDGKAALIVAVVALIALPVVVYFFDRDAEPLVVQRFRCPTFSFEGYGGVNFVPGLNTTASFFSGRVTSAVGHFGGDFQFDIGPVLGGWATHALLRITPKQHVEGAVALGYRAMYLNGDYRDGFEVGLPHRYVFWRSGLNSFGLELRPMLLFGWRGVDAALEATVVVPIWELFNARVGGRVASFGEQIVWTAQAGLTFVW